MKTLQPALREIDTQLTPVMITEQRNINEMTHNMKQGFVVVWLFHDIAFGTIINGLIRIRRRQGIMDLMSISRYFERARLFNDNKEIYLFRGKDNVIQGRIREDFENPEGLDTQCVYVKDVELLLRGRHETFVDHDWVEVSSQRGSAFMIPSQWTKGHRDHIVVSMRYYMSYVNHLATIVDQRIVRIGR
jgi:CRISPR-associated protein (TIGR03984 family)